MRRTFVLVMGAMLAIALVQPASAGAEDRVYPPDAQVHGMSYEEWHGAYQVWLNEIPAPKNPTFHISLRTSTTRASRVAVLSRRSAARYNTHPNSR